MKKEIKKDSEYHSPPYLAGNDSQENDETKGKYLDKDFVVLEFIKDCDICQGKVDKYPYTFRCRECGAFGEFFTGMMVDLSPREQKNE